MTTQAPAKPTTYEFFSKHGQLRLVRVQEDVEWIDRNRTRPLAGVDYQFENGHLTVAPGQDMLRDGAVDPETGEPTVQDAVAWLRAHEKFNSQAEGGFVELVPETPDSSPVLAEIVEAIVGQDMDRLVAIHEQEEAGWGREDVLTQALNGMHALEAASDARDSADTPPED